jgi:hypothetical protein
MSRPITTQARLLAAANWLQINRVKDSEVRHVIVGHAYTRTYRPPVISVEWDAFLRLAKAQARPPMAKIDKHMTDGKLVMIDISFVADGMEITVCLTGNMLDKLPHEISDILAMLGPDKPKSLPGPKQARLPLLLGQ